MKEVSFVRAQQKDILEVWACSVLRIARIHNQKTTIKTMFSNKRAKLNVIYVGWNERQNKNDLSQRMCVIKAMKPRITTAPPATKNG